MVCNMKNIIVLCSFATVTIYLILAAKEDSKSCEVTRWKHMIGFIPAALCMMVHITDRDLFDIGMFIMFVLLCLLFGAKGIYGMADGFVFANLTLLFGSMGGIAGIGLVILIMILSCFSGMIEMLLRKQVTLAAFKGKGYIAFVPHILTGYTAVMIALAIWI